MTIQRRLKALETENKALRVALKAAKAEVRELERELSLTKEKLRKLRRRSLQQIAKTWLRGRKGN